MKRPFSALVGLLLLTALPLSAQTLTVAVAANVQFAFQALRAAFRQTSGIDVQGVVGSSGKLTAQIKNGAPFDLFLSANMKYPRVLYRDGWAANKPKIYAQGALVLWTMKDYDLRQGLKLLQSPDIRKVAVANPKNAPYGQEAMKALARDRLSAAVEPKLVYGESIAQTNQFIVSRAADIGITAKSVVLSPQMKGKGTWVDVDSRAYTPIAQGVVILRHGKETRPTAAKRFYTFLFSPAARKIFARFGYQLP